MVNYRALYRGSGRYLFNLGLLTDLKKNNSNYRERKLHPLEEIKNLPSDILAESDSYIDTVFLYQGLTNTNGAVTNYQVTNTNFITNAFVSFPDYFDYLSFVLEPSVVMNVSKKLSIYFRYSLALKRFKGQYAQSSKALGGDGAFKGKPIFDLLNILNFGFIFKNETGYKRINPFMAIKYATSNNDDASTHDGNIYDLYFIGIRTSYEF